MAAMRLRSRIVKLAFLSCLSVILLILYDVLLNKSGHEGSSVEDSDPKQSLVFDEMSVELEEVQNFLHKMQHLKKDPKKYQSLEILKRAIVSVKEEQANLQPLNRRERSRRTSEDEFAKRNQRVNFVCSAKNVSGNVIRVLSHDSGVLYCIVPKAGCTFWKRLFAAVQSQENITMETVNSISRESVHFFDEQYHLYNSSFDAKLFKTRFIVTRDPFSRLLSSYLDKVYLPDFWHSEIVAMIYKKPSASYQNPKKDFLREHFDQMAAIFKRNSSAKGKSTAEERECAKYVTFSEFITVGLNRQEPHWMPIHQICNPCLLNVTHISTMETFIADAKVLLSTMGLEKITDDFDDKAQVDEEIHSISKYNFHHFYSYDVSKTFYRACISPNEIAYRLWQNFLWRGYIDPEVTYKIPSFNNLAEIEKDFMSQVWSARKSRLQNRERMRNAKREFKEKAFASISKDLFLRISEKYELDFQLFGYTDIRDKLFDTYWGKTIRTNYFKGKDC